MIPVILSIGITPVLPFSYSEELVCPSGEVETVQPLRVKSWSFHHSS